MNRIEEIGLVKKINQVKLTPGISLSAQNTFPEDIWNEIIQKFGENQPWWALRNDVNKSIVIATGNMRATCKAFYNLPLPQYFKSLRKYFIERAMFCCPNSIPGKKMKQEMDRRKNINQQRLDDWYYGKGYIYCPKPKKLDLGLSPYRYYNPSREGYSRD